MSIIAAILGLQVLIVFHELGHYLFARWSGMRVERFSVGFGPRLFGWQSGETAVQLAAVPFGGFVQIAGMNPEETISPDDKTAYPNKPMWQRFLVVLMGPVMNLLVAYVLLTAALAHGVDEVDTQSPVIGATQPGSLAERSGLLAGDRVLQIDHKPVGTFEDIPGLVQGGSTPAVLVSVSRAGANLELTLTPEDGKRPSVLGLLPSRRLRKSDGLAAFSDGARETANKSLSILRALGGLFTGHSGRLVGLPGIVKMVGGEASHGIAALFVQLAVLSINLGLFNLLPLPALDGGRLVFLGYEGIARRRANLKIENAVHAVGMAALLLLLVVVSLRDLIVR